MTTIEKLDLALADAKEILFTQEWRDIHYAIKAKHIEGFERDYMRQISKESIERYLKDDARIKYVLEIWNCDMKNTKTAFMYVATNNKNICEKNYKTLFEIFVYNKEIDDPSIFLKKVILEVKKCIRETEIQTQNQTSNPNNNGVNKKEYIRDDHIYPLCIAHVRYGSKKTYYQEEKEKELLVDRYEFFQRILERTPNLTIRFTDDPKRAISVEELFNKFGGKEAEKKDK